MDDAQTDCCDKALGLCVCGEGGCEASGGGGGGGACVSL